MRTGSTFESLRIKKGVTLLLFLLFLASNIYPAVDWKLVKETTLRGSINGTIQEGYLFKVSSYEFYVVTGGNRQRVRLRNPEVKIFTKTWGSDYLLVIEGVKEPFLCEKITHVTETEIDGQFTGWDGDTVFRMANGGIWQQASYGYEYHHSYRPDVIIYQHRGYTYMQVEDVDKTIKVRSLEYSAIKSRIDGEFKGWDGDTVFKLTNGQVWQQDQYGYVYHYAYNPEVIIYKVNFGYEMMVKGLDQTIKVKRLK